MSVVERTGADRGVIRTLDPLSAARLTFALGLTFCAVVLVGLGALYLLGTVSGAVSGIEEFIAGTGPEGFSVTFLGVLPFFLVVSLVSSAAVAGIAALTALLYNILAELVGGIEVGIGER